MKRCYCSECSEWKLFNKHKPNKDGWYICTIEVPNQQRYVMSLYWHSNKQKFIDNIRDDVCQTYSVISITGERLFDIGQDRTDEVIAWQDEFKPYMEGFIRKSI